MVSRTQKTHLTTYTVQKIWNIINWKTSFLTSSIEQAQKIKKLRPFVRSHAFTQNEVDGLGLLKNLSHLSDLV